MFRNHIMVIAAVSELNPDNVLMIFKIVNALVVLLCFSWKTKFILQKSCFFLKTESVSLITITCNSFVFHPVIFYRGREDGITLSIKTLVCTET